MLVDLKERWTSSSLRFTSRRRALSSSASSPVNCAGSAAHRFLGFTLYCAWSQEGRFVVKRRTDRQRLTRKLKEFRSEARRRMHRPIVVQNRWLCRVLRGHFAYFGLPSNWDRLNAFYQETRCIWYCARNRRSQRRLSWERYSRLRERFPLTTPNITHPRAVVAC
jgi:RNA-directed DNA polymerase